MARKVGDSQPPKRTRRMRVVAQLGQNDVYTRYRDVYLESRELPVWETDLFDLQIPAARVVDMVRWAESIGLSVTYEPPGNMEDYFLRGRRDDVQSLFT